MRKFKITLALAVASLVAITVIAPHYPESSEWSAGPGDYCGSMLNSGCGNLQGFRREDDRIYFMDDWGHGVSLCWVSGRGFAATCPEELKKYMDYLAERPQWEMWERRDFEVLTGRTAKDGQAARDWWRRNRDTSRLTSTLFETLLLDRQRRLAKFEKYRQVWKEGKSEEAMKADPEVAEGAALAEGEQFYHWRMSHATWPESWVERFLVLGKPLLAWWRQLIFEGLYFAAFVFFSSYVVPAGWRRMKKWRFPIWVRFGLTVLLVYSVLVLPFAFGYTESRRSWNLEERQIIYGRLLLVIATPIKAALSLLTSSSLETMNHLFRPVNWLLYPFLGPLSDPLFSGADKIDLRPAFPLFTGAVMSGILGFFVGVVLSVSGFFAVFSAEDRESEKASRLRRTK